MTRSWRRQQRVVRGLACLALLAGTAAAAGIAWGRSGIVTTLTGEHFEGDVTERGDDVVIAVKGKIAITRPRNQVTIEYPGTTKKQFERQLAKLDKNDSDGRVKLARWAIDKRELDLALDALDEALKINPNDNDAAALRSVVEKQQRIQRMADDKTGVTSALVVAAPAAADRGAGAPASGRRPAAAPAAGQPASRRSGPVKTRLVTASEINHIRQLELQKKETVQVRFQNDVKHRYLANASVNPQNFNKMTPLDQAHEILGNGDPRLWSDVLIMSDPASVAQFKHDVQRYVLPGCATAACHGTFGKAGNFFLHNPTNKENETYTNFLLLQQYPVTGDSKESQPHVTIDGRDYSMVDRQKPENSLLLLYALPLKDSPQPHPDVQGFKPIFRGKNDGKYQSIYNWMHDTLAPVAPEYGIDLTKEPDESTTRPARGGGGGAAGGGERTGTGGGAGAGTGRPTR
jgi:hypothetical protein